MYRNAIIENIANTLHRDFPEVEVVLYGSEARGDARLDSDIDLLVLFDKDKITLEDKDRVGIPLYDIELQTNTLINPIYYTKQDWKNRPMDYFKWNIQQEGRKL